MISAVGEASERGFSWRELRQRFRAVWKLDLSPAAVGAGVALGVFIGCSPFLGLHTVLIFALAALLRINPWVALLSSQISLPPLFVVIAAAEVGVGEWVRFGRASLPKVIDAATFAHWLWTHAFVSWLLGSALFGGLLAAIGGAAAWLIATLIHALRRRRAGLSVPR
jgi:uncharacterized protein (DUF2062 family)